MTRGTIGNIERGVSGREEIKDANSKTRGQDEGCGGLVYKRKMKRSVTFSSRCRGGDTVVNNERAKTQSRTLLTVPSNEKLCRSLIKFLDFIALSATAAVFK